MIRGMHSGGRARREHLGGRWFCSALSALSSWLYADVVAAQPPVLTISAPAAFEVARPMLHVSVSCTDGNSSAGCSKLSVEARDSDPSTPGAMSLTASGSSSIDTMFDLTPFVSGRYWLVVYGESSGEAAEVVWQGFVTTDARLTAVASTEGQLLDFDQHRYLYRDAANDVRIEDTRDHSMTVLGPASATDESLSVGRLTSTGAVWQSSVQTCSADTTYFYQGGSSTAITESQGCGFLHTQRGDNLLVQSGTQPPVLWNLADGSKTTLTLPTFPTAGTNYYALVALGPDGAMAAVGRDTSSSPTSYPVLRFQSGSFMLAGSLVAPPSGYDFESFVYDGTHLASVERAAGGMHQSKLYDFNHMPSALGLSKENSVLVNGGWTAYTAPDASSNVQVWKRAPDGSETQLTFFSADTNVLALNEVGEVVVLSGDDDVYWISAAGVRVAVPDGGEMRAYCGGWVFLLGNAAFTLTDVTAPNWAACPQPPDGTGPVSISDAGVPVIDAGAADAGAAESDAAIPGSDAAPQADAATPGLDAASPPGVDDLDAARADASVADDASESSEHIDGGSAQHSSGGCSVSRQTSYGALWSLLTLALALHRRRKR